MVSLVTAALLFVFVLSQLGILEGAFYDSAQVEIPKTSLIGRFPKLSGTACIHRCRRNTSCHQAAMQGPDCVLFGVGDDSRNNEGELMTVTMLTKMRKVLGKRSLIIMML